MANTKKKKKPGLLDALKAPARARNKLLNALKPKKKK